MKELINERESKLKKERKKEKYFCLNFNFLLHFKFYFVVQWAEVKKLF
jgi:hypothetical protein